MYNINEIQNKILCGDCLEILKQIPDESASLILTDPPYMISNDTVIVRGEKYKYKGKNIIQDYGEWDKQWKNKSEYIEWCKLWWKECIRILKPYRHLLFFFDKAKVSYAWDYMEEFNMKGRPPMFWKKTNPPPRARCVGFMISIEEILWFTKNKVKREFFNWQLGMGTDCFEHCIVGHTTKIDGKRKHPTQKPIKLMQYLISYLSKEGDIVLDCFAGSGSTLVAAKQMGRKYVGIEINPDYCKVIKQRLAQEVLAF